MTIMLERIFSSRVRVKILKAFFMSPGISHNAWELSTQIDEFYSAVWRELINLEQAGILSSTTTSQSKNYLINNACPIKDELSSIILKTVGLGDVIRSKLDKLGPINCILIFGSYASGEADLNSDIDLLIIGKIDLVNLSGLIAELESEIKRQINFITFEPGEWLERKDRKDPLVTNILKSPKVFLMGDAHAL
jgi:predicted nucleotidyltransferase